MTSDAAEERAFSAYAEGKYEFAYPKLAQLAERGDVHALMAVGWIHESGVLGEKKLEVAKSFYEKAAIMGSLDAINRLGRLVINQGSIQDAVSIFREGSSKGSVACKFHLGNILTSYDEYKEEYGRGVLLLEEAASQGHLFATRRLISINWAKSTSLVEKIHLSLKFISTTFRFIKQTWSNPSSDNIA